MKKILIILLLLFAPEVFAADTTYYVTQVGAGDNDGTALGNAWSIEAFNASTNWSSSDNAAKIDPGDTVEFHGIITLSSVADKSIIPAGSGTSGNVITLDGTNAPCNFQHNRAGFISVTDKKYLTIQNFDIDGNRDNSSEPTSVKSVMGILLTGNNPTAGVYPLSNITIDQCDFDDTHHGILVLGTYQHITITRNNFTNLHGSGVRTSRRKLNGTDGWPWGSYVTVGGASGYGNTFYNVGIVDTFYDTDAFMHMDTIENSVMSYNYGHNDTQTYYGMSGIYMNCGKHILIERNILHDFYGYHVRPIIAIKGDTCDGCIINGPYVVRENHLYNAYSHTSDWGGGSGGISVSGNYKGVYITANYIHHVSSGMGFTPGWAQTLNEGCSNPNNANYVGDPYYNPDRFYLYTDGIEPQNIYVWNNVIHDTAGGGIGTAGSELGDGINYLEIWNNTFFQCTNKNQAIVNTLALWEGNSGYVSEPYPLKMGLKGSQSDNHKYANNLFINSRPNASDYRQHSPRTAATNTTIDYNYYYDAASTDLKIVERSDPGVVSIIDWDDAGRTFGAHDDGETNPQLVDIVDDGDGAFDVGEIDLRPTENSTAIVDQGTAFNTGQVDDPAVVIQTNVIDLNYAVGLGPNTVWSATEPDDIVIDLDERGGGGWDIGAYEYDGTLYSDPGGSDDDPDPNEDPNPGLSTYSGAVRGIPLGMITQINRIDVASYDKIKNVTIRQERAQYSTNANCVAAWLFEQDYYDYQGTNHLIANVSPGIPAYSDLDPAQGNYSALFTGDDNEYFYIADADMDSNFPLVSTASAGDFSIGFRFKLNADDAEMRMVGKYVAAAGDRQIEIAFNGDDTGGFTDALYVLHGTTDGADYESGYHASDLATGTWYTGLYTENGTTGAYNLYVYNNDTGAAVGSTKTGTWANVIHIGDAPFAIGNRTEDNDATDGFIDEVVVWDKVLSETERDDFLGGPIGAGCGDTNCPTGTYIMRWDSAYSGNTYMACFSDCAASKNGSAGGNVSFADGYVEFDDENEYITWPISGEIQSNVATSVFFSFYLSSADAFFNNSPIMQSVNGSDNFFVQMQFNSGNERLVGIWDAQGTENFVTIDADDHLSLNAWWRCGYSWDAANNKHSIACESGEDALSSWSVADLYDTDTETINTWTSEIDDIRIGDGASTTFGEDGIRIKDLIVVDGYQATDPL